MSEFNNSAAYERVDGLQSYMVKVFTKMGTGLLVTAAVAALAYFSNFWLRIPSSMMMLVYFGLAIAQIVVCVNMSRNLMSMEPSKTSTMFYAYSALTGLTFSLLLYSYTFGTVFAAFGFTAVMFFSCAVIGKTTNVDLTKFSGLMMGGLIALIVATVASMFIPALRYSLTISYLGIILFLGITAWDVQKIKSYYYGTNGGYGVVGENLAVYGAFQLYLDFINIFLYVLRILGNRRR